MKKLELHWQILIGMLLGILFGFAMTQISWGKEFVNDWIQPLGTIFVKLLKLIAIPLIVASLVKGISDLKDISKFRNIGLRTIATYIITTVVDRCTQGKHKVRSSVATELPGLEKLLARAWCGKEE